MDTGQSVRSTLEEISAKHLECPICTERYNTPKVLPCQHSFCEGCLVKYYQSRCRGAAKIHCPMCREETILHQSGIQGLKTNFHLVALIEEFELQEKVARSAETKPLCQVCDKGNEVQDRCMDCERNICKDCCKTHQQFPTLNTHKIASFDDIRQGKVSVTKQPDEYKCNKHEQAKKQFYCKTCQELVCHACTALDHPRPDHDFVDIGRASKEFRDSMKKDVLSLERDIQVLEVTKQQTIKAKKMVQDNSMKARKDVQAKAVEFMAKVKAEEKRLLDNISAHEQVQTKGLDEHEKRLSDLLHRKKHSLECTKDVTSNASNMDFLSLYPVINKDVAQLRGQQTPKIQHKLWSVKFVRKQAAFDIDLGKVKREGDKWEMSHEFGKQGKGEAEFSFARGIAAAAEPDEIAVADFVNKRVVILDHQGKTKGSIIPGDSQDVASMPDGWVVTNGRAVLVYKRDRTLDYQFNTVSESEVGKTEVRLLSVAVMDNGNIIVGDCRRKVLTVHRRGKPGKLLRSIPVRIRPDFLTVLSNGWIVISDWYAGLAEILDVSDDKITTIATIQPEIDGKPVKHCAGVCTDNSSIYIAVHALEARTGHIHEHNCTGQFVSCVARGLCAPQKTTFTLGQQLAVADLHTVKIYDKV